MHVDILQIAQVVLDFDELPIAISEQQLVFLVDLVAAQLAVVKASAAADALLEDSAVAVVPLSHTHAHAHAHENAHARKHSHHSQARTHRRAACNVEGIGCRLICPHTALILPCGNSTHTFARLRTRVSSFLPDLAQLHYFRENIRTYTLVMKIAQRT